MKSALPLLIALSTVACSSSDTQDAQDAVVIEIPDMLTVRDQPDDSRPDPDMSRDLNQPPDMAPSDMRVDLPGSAQCGAPTPGTWSGQSPAFQNTTDTTNFEALGVTGTRLAVSDLNGDGWPDLIVRRASDRARDHDFAPDGTAQVWLLLNDQAGSFTDHTQASNILARRDQQTTLGRPAEVFAFADVDNDGDTDAYTTFSNAEADALHPETAEIMLNNGDATFTLGDDAHALRVEATSPFSRGGASFTDYNRDGLIDLWVGDGGGQDMLYKNSGQGVFEDVTEELGLLTKPWSRIADLNTARAHTNAWSVAACDLNNDGRPELLSASYGRAPNHLWELESIPLSGVSYANRSIESGYAFDDRQDWSDNESARCHCKLTPTAPECEGVPEPAIRCTSAQDVFRWNHDFDRNAFRLGGNSGTTLCADLNNDGWLDLLTAEIRHWDVGTNSDPTEILYNTQQPTPTFTRPGNDATGLANERSSATWDEGDITAATLDFDNDGRLDLYVGSTSYNGTRGRLYHQQEDGTFKAVALDLGIDHKSSHGVAIADFDRDGDLDLIAGHARGRCSSGDHCYPSAHVRRFENIIGNQNNWIQLDLEGVAGTNQDAIGARITVETEGLTQTHEIGGGHGHYGIQHERVAHFGLGSACEATVTIQWPDRTRQTQTFTLNAGARYRVAQGEEPVMD